MTSEIKRDGLRAGLLDDMRGAYDDLDMALSYIRAAADVADIVATQAQLKPMPGTSATKRERICNAVDRAAFELGELLGAAECAARWVRAACDVLDAEGMK